MVEAPVLEASRCAVCDTPGDADEVYPPRLDDATFTASVFSARRRPDRRHYRIVRCRACGLVRSDPRATGETLARLYQLSHFDYDAVLPSLRRTYGACLARLERHGAAGGDLLEVGAGSGFLLEEALARGYRSAVGVEPSREAVEHASPDRRARLVNAVMAPGLLGREAFDVACMFQVLDHLPDPAETLLAVRDCLRPGGLLLCFNHDVEGRSARLLGERSPIFDVEHTYLFSRDTIRRLLERCDLEVLEVGEAVDEHTLGHLLHLAPLPGPVATLAGRLPRTLLAPRLRIRLGNLFAIARRPLDVEP